MTDDNVVYAPFDFETIHDLPPEDILNAAIGNNLTVVTIIGEDEDGKPYYGSSTGDLQMILWQLEIFKKKLLEGFGESSS